MADCFQDTHGALGALGIFRNGALVAEAPGNSDAAYELRSALEARYPGCEVLARCPNHPNVSAVDCLDCWPIEEN